MAKVVVDVSVSLDGFMAGPNVSVAEPMGEGGERLHDWMGFTSPSSEIDEAARQLMGASVGAAIVGRRTFEVGVGPWGGTPWRNAPTFVVTHRVQPDVVGKNGGIFAFDGLESAVRRAKEAAGEKNVNVLGGAVTQALIRANLLDELRLHIVPLLLGAGTPLFAGETATLIPEGLPTFGSVTHLRFRVRRAE